MPLEPRNLHEHEDGKESQSFSVLTPDPLAVTTILFATVIQPVLGLSLWTIPGLLALDELLEKEATVSLSSHFRVLGEGTDAFALSPQSSHVATILATIAATTDAAVIVRMYDDPASDKVVPKQEDVLLCGEDKHVTRGGTALVVRGNGTRGLGCASGEG